MAPCRRAHARQDGLDQRHRTEEVGREQGGYVAVVALLDGGAVAVAGVVDQDVDRAEALVAGPNGLSHLPGVGDVERHG